MHWQGCGDWRWWYWYDAVSLVVRVIIFWVFFVCRLMVLLFGRLDESSVATPLMSRQGDLSLIMNGFAGSWKCDLWWDGDVGSNGEVLTHLLAGFKIAWTRLRGQFVEHLVGLSICPSVFFFLSPLRAKIHSGLCHPDNGGVNLEYGQC